MNLRTVFPLFFIGFHIPITWGTNETHLGTNDSSLLWFLLLLLDVCDHVEVSIKSQKTRNITKGSEIHPLGIITSCSVVYYGQCNHSSELGELDCGMIKFMRGIWDWIRFKSNSKPRKKCTECVLKKIKGQSLIKLSKMVIFPISAFAACYMSCMLYEPF